MNQEEAANALCKSEQLRHEDIFVLILYNDIFDSSIFLKDYAFWTFFWQSFYVLISSYGFNSVKTNK